MLAKVRWGWGVWMCVCAAGRTALLGGREGVCGGRVSCLVCIPVILTVPRRSERMRDALICALGHGCVLLHVREGLRCSDRE